jgi:asparagine synthetase B (glutamine-hydrolysing)
MSHLEARGPEGTKITHLEELAGAGAGATFGFTRLAINGLHEGGMQPFDSNYTSWMCNGEIYNFKHIETKFGYVSKGSDCEVL